VISDLNAFTGPQRLSSGSCPNGLAELPSTLQAAHETLDRVHPPVEATVPLLARPQAGHRPAPLGVAQPEPGAHDLRPSVEQLKPTLEADAGPAD